MLQGSENMLELKHLTGVKLTWKTHSEIENAVESLKQQQQQTPHKNTTTTNNKMTTLD